MPRVMLAFFVSLALAAPALADEPAGLAPDRAETWVEVLNDPAAGHWSIDRGSVMVDGDLRLVRVRQQADNSPTIAESWIQFDCARRASRLIERLEQSPRPNTPIPGSEWIAQGPGALITPLYDAVCAIR